jgi:hypothetical protein
MVDSIWVDVINFPGNARSSLRILAGGKHSLRSAISVQSDGFKVKKPRQCFLANTAGAQGEPLLFKRISPNMAAFFACTSGIGSAANVKTDSGE